MKFLKEICANCGFTFGSHKVGNTPEEHLKCPATEGGIDFKQGPGTKFKSTGEYKDEQR